MRYMLLIYEDEATDQPGPEELQKWFAVTGEMEKAGVLRGGDALEPTSSARTVRLRNGERQITDGPFAETREQFGGFYVLDVPDMEAALEWAARLPNVGRGSVEVRPVMEFEQAGQAEAEDAPAVSAPEAAAGR